MTVESGKGYMTIENGFTIECWFWRDAPPVTNYAVLLYQRTQSQPVWTVSTEIGRQLWFGFAPTTGAFHLSMGNEGGTNVFNWLDGSPTGYQGDSQWHHVALSLDKLDLKTMRIYLDGNIYTTQAAAAPFDWSAGAMSIGGSFLPKRGVVGSYAWDKRLAYLAMFDEEITANRVLEHYTAGHGGTVYYGDDEVERLNRIFGWAGIPENQIITDAAVSTLQGIDVTGTNALTGSQETAEYAGGYVFANGQAAMVYHNRRHRYNKVYSMLAGEANHSAPEVGITFSTNQAFIFNDIRGDRPFGSQVRLINVASIEAHGRKVNTFTLKITDPEELKNAVSWLLERYGEDRVRVSNVTFSCATSYTLLDLAYARIEVGDLFVIDDMTDPAPTSRMEFYIEGMSVDVDFLGRQWDVSLELSPAELSRVFQIGVSKLGAGDFLPY